MGFQLLSKTRRASDGSVEWRCSKCLLFKPIDSFVKTDSKRGYICKACESLETTVSHSSTLLDFLLVPAWTPVNTWQWERAVWRHIYRQLPPIEATAPSSATYREKCANRAAKRRKRRRLILLGIRAKRENMRTRYRACLLSLLASKDLERPDDYFWLVLQREIFGQRAQRLLSVGMAKYIVQLSGLYAQDPQVEDVFFEVRHAAMSDKEPTPAIRQITYDIWSRLQREYNPISMHRASMALTATCFPDAREALIATLNWAVESWLEMQKIRGRDIVSDANKKAAIMDFLEKMRQLTMPLAGSLLEEDGAVQRLQRWSKSASDPKVGKVVDYDAIEIDY